MSTTPYLGDFYWQPLDPASADIWQEACITMYLSHDAALGREQATSCIVNPEAITYTIAQNNRWAGTIKSVTFETDAGTLTANVKINNISVTSLNAIAVTSSESITTATGANTFVAGDNIQFTLSSVSGVTVLKYNIWIDRTSAGTA